MQAGRSGNRHIVLQFDHSPNANDTNTLSSMGATVVAALPDQALMVSLPANSTLPESVIWSGALQTGDKLSGDLIRDGWNAVVVEFHSDVSAAAQDEIAADEGLFLVRNTELRAGHALAYGSYTEFAALAAHDEVAYIFPADQQLAVGGEIHACAGLLTQNGPVAQYANIVHGWDLDSDGAANLSYVFGETTSKLPPLQVQAEIIRALSAWSLNANVVFKPGSDAGAARTIYIRIVSGAHGDPFPFDGPGGILAHTFYPVPVNSEPLAGDMHLDADENWHVGGDIDIYSVALHEAGHAIGLGHSDKPGDVMYPYYRTGMRLSANDIAAARQLYGAPSAAYSPITQNPTPVLAPPVVPVPTSSPSPTPVSAPVLTVNFIPSFTGSALISIGGTVSGGSAPVTVTWQNGRLGSGKASMGSAGKWAAANIPLQAGVNVLTINAMDSSHRSITKNASVTFSPPSPTGDTSSGSATQLRLIVQNPASSVVTTSQETITISGVSSGGTGTSTVNWHTSAGYTGSATLASGKWTATGIPLLVGTNTIVLQSIDGAGATVWASMLAVRH